MKILRINMTEKKMAAEPMPEDKILGGRGLIDEVLAKGAVALAHPLSPDNKLIFAPGFFAGTNVPTSGRLSVGAKSPLTGGIKEANVGGVAGHKLGRLGIQGVIVEGKSDRWHVLVVSRNGAALERADDSIGLKNYSACEKLKERYGSKVGIVLTGPAGEMGLGNSTVAVVDTQGYPSRHAARGGLGAVMGAKRLKAIVIDDGDAPLRKAVREKPFLEANKELVQAILANPMVQGLHHMGTSVFVDGDNARGCLPTRNHRSGAFDKVSQINAEAFLAKIKSGNGSVGHGCMPGCAVRCSTVYHDASGHYVTSALEFETIALLGSNLGIDDLDVIARMDRQCDELGLDTMEMGCAIGVLNDVGLFQFGDAVHAEA